MALSITLGLTYVLGEYAVPLTWTSESAIERELERSTRANERWGSDDLDIEVTHHRVAIVRHSPFTWDLADGVEPGERGSFQATLHVADLEPHACVSYRVALEGSDWLIADDVEVEEDGVLVAEGGASGRDRWWGLYYDLLSQGSLPRYGWSASVVWCSPDGGHVRLIGTFRRRGGTEPRAFESIGGDHVAHVVLGRTPAHTLLWAHRSNQTAAGMARWRSYNTAVDQDSLITPVVESSWSRGVPLLPASRAVWLALSEASAHETGIYANPRTDAALRDGAAPFGRANTRYPNAHVPGRSAPVILWRGETRRVIAAVDLGELGAPCVRVSATRLEASRQPPRVLSVAIPSGTTTTLDQERNTASERACPARGLRLYLVPQNDRAAYEIAIGREEGSPDARAEASTFEGNMPLEAATRCAGGDDDACEQEALQSCFWPALADRREHGRALLARLSEEGRARARIASTLCADPIEWEALSALCGPDEAPTNGTACMRLGDARRRQASEGHTIEGDRALAMNAYERACTAGVSAGCFNLRAFYP